MKKEDLVNIPGLSEEQISAIIAASEAELKTYIPKTRFDEVNERMKTAEQTVKDRDKQIEDLGKSNGDVEALRKQINDLTEQNAKAMQEKEAEIKQIKIDTAINDALKSANAKNLKAVRALLNLDNIELDEAGNIKYLDTQIKTLQEADDTKFLFESKQQQQQTPFMKGVTPATPPAKAAGDGSKPQSLKEALAAKFSTNND